VVDRKGQKDPYEVLGLARDASPAEVRAAYRRAVVQCHPDSRPEDPDEAMRRFAEVTVAYERITGGAPAATTPEQHARMDISWLLTPLPRVADRAALTPAEREDLVRVERATCDEPGVFLLFWALGMAVGLTVFFAAVNEYQASGATGLGPILVMGLLCEGILLAVMVATYLGLVHSRQIIWLIGLLGFWRRPRLPAPPPPLPKTPTGRDLPPGENATG